MWQVARRNELQANSQRETGTQGKLLVRLFVALLLVTSLTFFSSYSFAWADEPTQVSVASTVSSEDTKADFAFSSSETDKGGADAMGIVCSAAGSAIVVTATLALCSVVRNYARKVG